MRHPMRASVNQIALNYASNNAQPDHIFSFPYNAFALKYAASRLYCRNGFSPTK